MSEQLEEWPPDRVGMHESREFSAADASEFAPDAASVPAGPAGGRTRMRMRRVGRYELAGLVLIAALGIAAVVVSSFERRTTSHQAGSPGVGDVPYTSTAGHYRAVFPDAPTEQSLTSASGTVSLEQNVAEVNDPFTAVDAETLSISVPPDRWEYVLRGALGTFANGFGVTAEQQADTTFQGHPALHATMVSPEGGTRFELLIVMYSGSRLYYLAGPPGKVFTTLEASFVASP